MPRGKRFKILKTAIRKYKAPVTVPGTPFTSLTNLIRD